MCAALRHPQHSQTTVFEYSSVMDKKEINSPKLTAHFVIWMCVGCLLLREAQQMRNGQQ